MVCTIQQQKRLCISARCARKRKANLFIVSGRSAWLGDGNRNIRNIHPQNPNGKDIAGSDDNSVARSHGPLNS